MRKIFNEQIERFRIYLIEEEKSSATVEKYIRDITAFCVWLHGENVEKVNVLNYKKYLSERYAPASVNSMLSSINCFFIYNEWYDLKVKTIKIQRQIFASKDNELTKSEYGRLLDAAKNKKNEKLYLLMQTICGSGIRVSELCYITIEAVKQRKALIKCKGKMRVVMLPKDLCKILSDYAKLQKITTGCIFVTKTGKPLDRSNIWKMMKTLSDDAKVLKNKVYPHNLRHLFARTYYNLQKDIVRLADILGHSNIETTRIYTIESGEIHRRQIEKLGLLRL